MGLINARQASVLKTDTPVNKAEKNSSPQWSLQLSRKEILKNNSVCVSSYLWAQMHTCHSKHVGAEGNLGRPRLLPYLRQCFSDASMGRAGPWASTSQQECWDYKCLLLNLLFCFLTWVVRILTQVLLLGQWVYCPQSHPPAQRKNSYNECIYEEVGTYIWVTP